MREIKFRFWKDDQMKHWSDFSCLDMCDWLNKDDVVPMQFTGLKDKNGKEIYEGDIVEYNNGEKRGEVYWHKHSWNVSGYYELSDDDPGDAFGEGLFLVIGNIYENPELLETQ